MSGMEDQMSKEQHSMITFEVLIIDIYMYVCKTAKDLIFNM